MLKNIRVGIIGTRGIPNRYGGFERFVELLTTHATWENSGFSFVIYGEGHDVDFNEWTELRNVGISKNERPLVYYFKSVFLACRECDVIFCCGVGLSVIAFWPLLRGRTLIVNPDGCEWRRTKWSRLGRLIIRAMYWPALAAAKRIVIDAEALREDFGAVLGHKAQYIGYQAPEPLAAALTDPVKQRFAIDRPFFLVIARLEPENNIQLIVEAFSQLSQGSVDLLVVGGTSTPFFTEALSKYASPNLRFLGAIFDQEVLGELRSNCAAYLHGHSVGGTNPSLLEALATVRGHLLCHDNKYNQEVAGAEARYFADSSSLQTMLLVLIETLATGDGSWPRTPSREERFHPDTIANRYLQLFKECRATC